jgi:O-antigen/teichoic acid export membrane protein
MFDGLSLPDLVSVSRRTALTSVICGVVGMVACLLFSQPWGALGLALGIGLGLLNFRLIQRSVIKVGQQEGESHRRPLAMNTLARMFAITVLAIGLLFVKPPLGFGLLGGLALFQLILLLNVTRSMLKMSLAGNEAAALRAEGGRDTRGHEAS